MTTQRDGTEEEYLDFPIEKVLPEADRLARQGLFVHQKYTCASCGERLTMEQPNLFFDHGTCCVCGTVTDIAKQGCNYLVANRRITGKHRR
jgi:hypothetical protein